MRRLLPALLVLPVALAATALAPVEAIGTAEVTDPCGEAREDGSVLLDEHDLCRMTATLDARGPVPELTLAYDVHGTTRTAPAHASAGWTSGDCSFAVVHEEGRSAQQGTITVQLPPTIDVHIGCGEYEDRCYVVALGLDVHCEQVREHEETVTFLAGPEGVDPVITVRFEGPLADYADLHGPGSTLRFGSVLTGPAHPDPFERGGLGVYTCPSGCVEVGTDFVLTDVELVVPDPEDE